MTLLLDYAWLHILYITYAHRAYNTPLTKSNLPLSLYYSQSTLTQETYLEFIINNSLKSATVRICRRQIIYITMRELH